jgi:hypothetical protein
MTVTITALRISDDNFFINLIVVERVDGDANKRQDDAAGGPNGAA